MEMELTDFEIEKFYPTQSGRGEFFVCLRRLPKDLSREQMKGRQRARLSALNCDLNILSRPLQIKTALGSLARLTFLAKALLRKFF